jgi:mono/diheme cytochrome c family protein
MLVFSRFLWRSWLVVLAGLLMAVFPFGPAQAAPDSAALESFEKKIRPLLATHCWKCHGSEKVKGGLRLDTAQGLARGGEMGPVVLPGKPEESLVIRAVRHAGDLKMPPSGKLKEQEISDLAAWIKSGAVWPGADATVPLTPPTPTDAGLVKFTPEQKGFWAFQPVKTEVLPSVRMQEWARSPLDRFILAKLEAAGLSPSPPADKRSLIRRVTFDLTGLPPTPQEIDTFLADRSADAFAKVVDRLLASPHYGERWARHWLDVVRYAESTANDANAVMRYAYRYRDYTVNAFNKDKPYDQFLIEQLAGDLLPAPADANLAAEQIIATGFLMIGPKALAETDKEQSRLDVIDDQIDVVGRAFLGLTVGCARCHDHKFDPIPTIDYYSLAGIFRSTEVFRDEVRNASMWQEWPLPSAPGKPAVQVMAPKEGTPANLRIHIRGNRNNLGQVAPRRFLQILGGEQPLPTTAHSGRLELARWNASKENPLTARVMVNRIWQHHFGTGLVATSDNFGARGEKPSHPELLDWLAGRFVEAGWSVKAMHRLMLLSNTYQMSSVPNEQALQTDPGNRMLWRMPRPRLDAESLRDAMLAVSGRLDRTLGGNEAAEFVFGEAEVIDKKRDFFRPNRVKADHPYYTTSTRRSIYLPVVRNALPDILTLFDAADPNGVTAVRNDTTVPSQALFLLNHPFVREQALHFARRLLADPKSADADRIRAAYVSALAREPRPDEVKETLAFLERYQGQARAKGRKPEDCLLAAWQSFCQTLFCCNEFLYVE